MFLCGHTDCKHKQANKQAAATPQVGVMTHAYCSTHMYLVACLGVVPTVHWQRIAKQQIADVLSLALRPLSCCVAVVDMSRGSASRFIANIHDPLQELITGIALWYHQEIPLKLVAFLLQFHPL
jgi:hypothetical protein